MTRRSLPVSHLVMLLVSAALVAGCGGEPERDGLTPTGATDRVGEGTTQVPVVHDEWTVLLAELVDGRLLEPISIEVAEPEGLFVLATDPSAERSALTLLRLGAAGELDWVVELSGEYSTLVWRSVLPALDARDDGSVEILRLRTESAEGSDQSNTGAGTPELVLTRVSADGKEVAEVALGLEAPASADTDGTGETVSLTFDQGQAVVRAHGVAGSSLWATEVGQPDSSLAELAFTASVSPRVRLAEDGVYVATAESSDDPAALRGLWTADWSLAKLSRETGEVLWTEPLRSAVSAMDVIGSRILVGQSDPGQGRREGMLIEVFESDGSPAWSVQAPRSYTTPYAVSVQGSRAILLTDAEGTDTSESILQTVEDGTLETIGSFGMSGMFFPSTWATDVVAIGDGSLAVAGYNGAGDPDFSSPNIDAGAGEEGGFVTFYSTVSSAGSSLGDPA